MCTLDRLLYAETLHRPEATAVAHEGETLTFRELSEGALVLGQYLRSLGAGGAPGEVPRDALQGRG